jgi:hypothetical protein
MLDLQTNDNRVLRSFLLMHEQLRAQELARSTR